MSVAGTLHIRTQLRAAVIALLDRATGAGPNVFPSRPDPLTEDERPGLVVLSPEENASVDTMGDDPMLLRTVQVIVIAYVTGDPAEDKLDALCLEVETLLAANRRLGGLAYEVALSNTKYSVDQGSQTLAEARMTFDVTTRTTMGRPGTFA